MSFENERSESDRPKGEEFQARSQNQCIGAMKRMRDKVKYFVDSVREAASRDTLRNISTAAGVAKDYVNEAAGQAKDYIENVSVQGTLRDIAELIKRYPLSAMIAGITIGFFLSRRREN